LLPKFGVKPLFALCGEGTKTLAFSRRQRQVAPNTPTP
jgi:hypothetical protein